jgi:hypothetical protein
MMISAMDRKMAELLVRDNVLTQADVDLAFTKQSEQGGSLGRILIDNGYASEYDLANTLGKHLNVPFMTLSHYEIDPDILRSIPTEIVRKYRIIPVDKAGDTLTVALADPSNLYLLDELRLLTQCKIVPVISFDSDIQEAIQTYYGQPDSDFDDMLKEITEMDSRDLEVISGGNETEQPDNELTVEPDAAPVIQLVNMIVQEAIKMRASDIHVEPYEKELRLRYRIDGVCHEMKSPPKSFQNAIISRIKIMSELDIAERRLPQDGRFKVTYGGKNIDFRVSTCPTVHGEKVVIRILDSSNLLLNLTDLGMTPEQLEKFEQNIRGPVGHGAGHGTDRIGKVYDALHRPEHHQRPQQEHHDLRRSGRVPVARDQSGRHKAGNRSDICQRAAQFSSARPRHHHGRRNPRRRDGRNRCQGRPHGPPCALDAPHQRCAQQHQPFDEHGRRTVPRHGPRSTWWLRSALCAASAANARSRTRRLTSCSIRSICRRIPSFAAVRAASAALGAGTRAAARFTRSWCSPTPCATASWRAFRHRR